MSETPLQTALRYIEWHIANDYQKDGKKGITKSDWYNLKRFIENNQEAANRGEVSYEGCKPHRQSGQKVDSKPRRKSLKTKIKEEWEEFKVYKPLM